MTFPRINGGVPSTVSVGVVTEKLALGIKSCEVALSSGSARIWVQKIKNAQKAQRTAERFVHRFRLSDPESHRINQQIKHLKSLLDELR